MTKEQIKYRLRKKGLNKVADWVEVLANGPVSLVSLEQMQVMYCERRVQEDEYDAYCYLWRNLSPRLSNELSQYQL